MSLQSYTGLLFQVAGIALEQFALYRKGISRLQRNCNDSKATLLLYFSTGICCELTALFLLPFTTYLISRIIYKVSLHLVFNTYFTFKNLPTLFFKISSFLILLSFCLLLFQSDPEERVSNTIGSLALFTVFIIVSIFVCLSRYTQHRLAKIALCSGFGTAISMCLKELVEITFATLEGIYPSFLQIILIFLLIGASSLAQCALSEILMKKCETYQMYSIYFCVNLLISTILAQLYCQEQLNFLGYASLVLSVAGAILLSSENYSDKSLLFEGAGGLGHT